jgi:hypothetical protein
MKKLLGVVVAGILLQGCGGGGSSSSAPSDPRFYLSDVTLPELIYPDYVVGEANSKFALYQADEINSTVLDAALEKLNENIKNGTFKYPLSATNKAYNIDFSNLTLRNEDDYAKFYEASDLLNDSFTFTVDGVDYTFQTLNFDVTASKQKATDFNTGYDDLVGGAISVHVSYLVNNQYHVSFTNQIHPMHANIGYMPKEKTHQGKLDEVLFSNNIVENKETNFLSKVLEPHADNIFTDFFAKYCHSSYEPTSSNLTTMIATDMHIINGYIDSVQVNMSDDVIVDDKGISHHIQSPVVYAQSNLSGLLGEEEQKNGVSKDEFDLLQQTVDAYGVYRYQMDFFYAGQWSSLTCN